MDQVSVSLFHKVVNEDQFSGPVALSFVSGLLYSLAMTHSARVHAKCSPTCTHLVHCMCTQVTITLVQLYSRYHVAVNLQRLRHTAQ